MNVYHVNEIPEDSFFSKTVYLDSAFVIAAPEMPFQSELAQTLLDWDFKELFSEGVFSPDYVSDADDENENSADAAITDVDKVTEAEIFYTSFQIYAETLFTRIRHGRDITFNEVTEKIKEACDVICDNRRFLMRALKNTEQTNDKNYLTAHTVRSTIIAIIIGTYFKLPAHRLIELGVAALFHEIGMLNLPQQIYQSRNPLTPDERKLILEHPLAGYNLLKAFDFPLVVSLAALEHHERENGSGYPRHLLGGNISLYAKIIAVACSYEALSSKRPHKEAKDGYTGMLELLKNEGGQYDNTVVRALVFSLSIYPIGLYVLLSNGKKGQVVDVNPENPRCPIVQIFGELEPDGKNKTRQISPEGLSIVRPLTREEIGN